MNRRHRCFLFDNGSLRAESTRNLRRIARALENVIGEPVTPVSLLHSGKVPAHELDGEPAMQLEPALDAYWLENPDGEAWLLPLFFGPSGAFVDYLPKRLAVLKKRHTHASWKIASPLADGSPEDDERIARILAERAGEALKITGWIHPQIVLVDHGSPVAAVTNVRNRLGHRLRHLLGSQIGELAAASMERRPEPEYDFNEPLLERALGTSPFANGPVIVIQQFLSPGRHAGPDGDIAEICRKATNEHPELKVHITDPMGNHPMLLEILKNRHLQLQGTSAQSGDFGSIKPISTA